MIVLVVCPVGLITVYDYCYLKSSIDNHFSDLQIQTEKSVSAGLRLDDKASGILDDQLNFKMKDGFDVLLAEYNRSGKNPMAMDLAAVKTTLGEGYDIYIINESGVIVYTTYPPELGQDFRKIPYFYEYLTKIRMSEGFFPDRVVHEILGTGIYRKYAYKPTPDHRYILELGYSSPTFITANQIMDNQNTIAEIVSVNPFIDQVRVFDMNGHRVDDLSLPDNQTSGYLAQVSASRQTLETGDPKNHTTTRYLFVDMKNPRYGSDLSRIVEITYNTGRVQDILNRLLFFHFLVWIGAIVVGCVLAYGLSRWMTRPIAKIARDVDRIASGDFDHRIGTTQAQEFMILEKGINTMIDSLKTANQKLDDEESIRRNVLEQIPVGIFLKKIDDGKYVFWNHANEEIFERSATEIVGKTDDEVFPPAVAAQIKKEDADAITSRVLVKYKRHTATTRGECVFHIIVMPIYDSKRSMRYILGIVEDVTEEAHSLKKDLIFSITRSDILHQLAIIMTYLERAQLKSTHEDMQKFFDKTIGSVESIKNQIAYEGELQNQEVITPQWQMIKKAFADANKILPEHRVDITDDAGNTEIYADPMLPRVFFTLLSASFRCGGSRLSEIRLTTLKRGDTLVLVYEDNSGGIPTSEKEKIFEFGYCYDDIISLFLTRELLAFTGITLTENGEPGKGIRFEIVVPKGRFREGK
ncbi:MAG TPA: PAS domain-containing protein [Methanoregula sp.]|nr:PAS domain-containing protein [Methanoregula sp.]